MALMVVLVIFIIEYFMLKIRILLKIRFDFLVWFDNQTSILKILVNEMVNGDCSPVGEKFLGYFV